MLCSTRYISILFLQDILFAYCLQHNRSTPPKQIPKIAAIIGTHQRSLLNPNSFLHKNITKIVKAMTSTVHTAKITAVKNYLLRHNSHFPTGFQLSSAASIDIFYCKTIIYSFNIATRDHLLIIEVVFVPVHKVLVCMVPRQHYLISGRLSSLFPIALSLKISAKGKRRRALFDSLFQNNFL